MNAAIEQITNKETQQVDGIGFSAVATGKTYKVEPVGRSHAIYMTINHAPNDGGETVIKELFFSSLDVELSQWLNCMSVLLNRIFALTSSHQEMIKELRIIFDPKGGYFMGGGAQANSIVDHIAQIIEQNMNGLQGE